ncbi:hypothetical protein A4G19_14455 [Pasteurellaceae bacterium Macca]|nr:hypothetical protein [Pasteurellaceae bacterium Macca]MCK3656122.1 hypothetical protein [Pasteurellaceae bacterium Macca]MCK3656865.1 hypothetical protein [Pasteurellaceae bacterium Macca]
MKKILPHYFTENSHNLPTNRDILANILHISANLLNINALTNGRIFPKFCTAVAKSIAEPRNSNDLSTANSTPKACFFIRSTRTPQERPERQSMVACSGKGFALCCVPLIAVFEPVTRYRQQASKLSAVALRKYSTELRKMLYTYLTRQGEKRLNITFYARNFTEAKSKLQAFNPSQPPLLIKRLPVAKCSQNQTACLASQGGMYA